MPSNRTEDLMKREKPAGPKFRDARAKQFSTVAAGYGILLCNAKPNLLHPAVLGSP